MEAAGALKLQSCSWVGVELAGRRPGGCSVGFSPRSVGESCVKTKKSGLCRVSRLRIAPVTVKCRGHAALDVSCCCKNPTAASTVESESSSASLEEALNLQDKSQEVVPYLNGRCIYLVGMMGSGKTTVGKIISEVFGYSFFDSDKLVEQAVGAASVAQIFQEHSENFFRDNESKVLEELSAMRRMVVATGGGAVIRPINWRYMKHGITVWLDVPLETLARRIAAVGTNSRPLLHDECGDPYTKAFMRLTTLWEERGEAYANADARVSLQRIAAKEGHDDVSSLTPTAIAIEALERIQDFIATQK